MEEKETDKIAAFDMLFTTNQMQMCKVLLTYLPPSAQQNFAIYIKMQELMYTVSFFKQHPHALPCALPHEDSFNMTKLCEELLPLCNTAQSEKLHQLKNMMETFENMQEMMELFQTMKELFPSDASSPEKNNFDFLSALTGLNGMPDLSSLDLSQLFEMFQTKNN